MWTKDGVIYKGVLIHDGVRKYGATEEDLINAGYVWEDPPPEIPIDTSAFDMACVQFRSICDAIGSIINVTPFRGGFDEMVIFQASPVYSTVEGLQLAMAWSAANELCKYEGSKLGLGQPEWWYSCWGITEEQLHEEMASNTTTT